MTVSTQTAVVEYLENGVTTEFQVPFRFLAATDLLVTRRVGLNIEPVAPQLVTGAGAPNGGTIKLTSSTSGAKLRISRRTARIQPTDYTPGDNFPAETHENALDRQMLALQETDASLAALSTRALLAPDGEALPALPAAALRGNRVLGFSADGATPMMMNLGGEDSALRDDLADPLAGGLLVAHRDDLSSTPQTVADKLRRQPLNLFDKTPRELWADIEQGTNEEDLTPYLMAAIGTGRTIRAPIGRWRFAATLDQPSTGLIIRGEGRASDGTVFENVDNRPILTMDSSTADLFGLVLEDMWWENRDVTFATCDLLKFLGAGNGEAHQNDRHVLNNMWLFRGRDNLAIYNRAVGLMLVNVNLTGALRDQLHQEVSANVNQLSLEHVLLKGGGRFGWFLKHFATPSGSAAYANPATGYSADDVWTEDNAFGGWRFTGDLGVTGFKADACTFENNGISIASGATPTNGGVVCRKANIFSDLEILTGLSIQASTFYGANDGNPANNPDVHVYLEGSGAQLQSGSMDDNRFSVTQTGVDVIWPKGLTYHASNVNAGQVLLDRTESSIDYRDALNPAAFNPALRFGGAAVGMTVSNQVGRFIINGRRVDFDLYVSISAKGSSVGEAAIAGLPYPSLNIPNLSARLRVEATGLAATADTAISARILPGEQVIRLFRYEAGTEFALTDADFGASAAIGVSGSYFL